MKKHRLSTVLAAALVGVSAAAFPTAAELSAPEPIVAEAANGDTFNYGNFEFTHGPGSNGATLTQYLGSSTTPSIPSQVYDWSGRRLTVKKIGAAAFQSQNSFGSPSPMNITSVTIPNTVTEIESWAFTNCPLTSVSFSNNLETIGDDAFYGCAQLTSITLPSGLTEIGENAFSYCTKLTSVTVPASVTEISSSAFASCTKLKTIDIKGAAQIGSSAFHGCTALTNAKLNANCTAEEHAFSGCTALARVNSVVPWTYQYTKPVFVSNSVIRNLIKNVFKGSEEIKFIDDYITAICDYVVRTETTYGSDDDWMSDAAKARQLHDWFILHYEYEDFYENGHQYPHMDCSILGMVDNQSYTSFFVSYGIDERGSGVGETVCAGSAKAFTMLLRAAGIESYVMRGATVNPGPGHEWNIIKIGDKYYQSDVGGGDKNYNTQLEQGINYYCITNYEHFLVSGIEMDNLQHHTMRSRSAVEGKGHPYFNYNLADARAAISQCNYHYDCSAIEGLLIGDWDFNGTVDYSDNILSSLVQQYYNSNTHGVLAFSAWFTDTVIRGVNPWEHIRWMIAQ